MNEITKTQKSFEEIKEMNQQGVEFWSARNLMAILGYVTWREFQATVKKAMDSCQESGNIAEYHFVAVYKMIAIGKGGTRKTLDYHLSRFACYLIAQNGNPRIPQIANAQKYFALQTRRQEVADQLPADIERLELRNQTKEEFKALSAAAKSAGVQNKMFGVFHDAGYKGLYAGLGANALKDKKGVRRKDNVLDYMDTTELAANQFRMTQTRDKLKREGIVSQTAAINTHEAVGKEVRNAIQKIGGAMPETLPTAEHIKQVEKRIGKLKPKLVLDDQSAKGLLAESDVNPLD